MARYTNVSLRVTGLTMYPFARVKVEENGAVTFDGLAGYMLSLLQQSMGFEIIPRIPPDTVWAGRNAQGVWAGQLGMVYRNEADLAIGPATPTEERFTVGHALPNYFDTVACHVAGRLISHVSNVAGHIGGFDTQIWLIIAGILLFLSVGLSLYERRKTLKKFSALFYRNVFELLGNLLIEASPRSHEDPHVRTVLAFWWMMLIVLMNTFTGHMKASMTVQEELPRIDTLQDIVDHRGVTPVVIRGSTFDEIFRVSTRRDHQLVWRRALQRRTVLSGRDIFVKSMFDDVLEGRKVIFLDTLLFHYWVGRFYQGLPRGEFYLAKEAVLYPSMCMWLNRNVDPAIARALHVRSRWVAESGMASHWKNLLVERSQRTSGGAGGSSQSAQSMSTASPLQLQDVAAVLQLLVAGACASLPVLVAEVAVHRRCAARRRCCCCSFGGDQPARRTSLPARRRAQWRRGLL
ncbi:putative glutamate receptor [Dermacentor variabilis]|uniref:putative glutamate receptor n=1 Tax=Dermacentor variabilis TaxID=34621 RepID=UPI003F5C17E2